MFHANAADFVSRLFSAYFRHAQVVFDPSYAGDRRYFDRRRRYFVERVGVTAIDARFR
jgi:hypothetical protein